MVFEKRLIILTGEGGAKGTLRIERNAYGLSALLNVYNLPRSPRGYVLLTQEGDSIRRYPLVLSSGGESNLRLDGQTNPVEAHFVVCEKGGSALMYGTLNRRRLWKGNLPDERAKEGGGEKGATASEKSNQEKEKIFSFSKRGELFLDIFPSGGGYADNAVASVNYYDESARSDIFDADAETNSKTRNEADDGENRRESRAEDLKNEKETNPSGERTACVTDGFDCRDAKKIKASTAADKPVYNDLGIRVEFIAGDGEKNARPTPKEGGDKLSISDLQYAFIKKRVGLDAAETVGMNTAAEKSEPHSRANEPQADYIRTLSGSGAQINTAAVKLMEKRLDAVSDGSSVLVPKLAEEDAGNIRGRKMSYYEQVSDQIEKLFSEGKRDEELEKLLPYTKWVRVDFSNDGRYYVVGLIGERPDYVCYGLPGKYDSRPPEELQGYCGWLPLDVRDPHGNGYWLLYQDAETGESVAEAER